MKHTANIIRSSLWSSWVIVVVVHLWGTHPHVGLARWCGQSCRVGYSRCSRATWSSHVGTVCVGLCLSCRHLRHPPDATTPQARILVAVSPAVDGTLDKPALAPQAGVQLCQRPADGVALRLVVKTVALVRILCAACARVDAVFGLEVWGKLIDVDRLHIASDSVLHLDAIARVLKSNPLNTVLVLPDNKRRCRRNGSGRSVGVDARTCRWTLVHVWGADWGCLGLLLRRAQP